MSGSERGNGLNPATRWFLLAVVAEVGLAVLDAAIGDETVFTTAFLLPVLALALVGREEHVSVVGALAFALALASGAWDDYLFTTDHLVRFTVVAVGCVLAVLSARAREQAEADRGRMERLAAVGRISDEPTLERALDRLGHVTVPAVADLCWVDLVEESGPRRVFSRGPEELEEGGIVIELRLRNREVGRLGFAVGPGRRPYDDDDRGFFSVLAGRVALALANTRLLGELSRTRERLDRILSSLAEAVTVHDARGKVVYANEAAAKLLGADSVEELIEAGPGELAARFIVTAEDGGPVNVDQYPGRRALAGDPHPPPMLVHSVHRETGRAFWTLTKATLLHEEDGEPLAVNVIEDVTEVKEAELRRLFLDEAGQVLASSLEYRTVLQRVAELAVPGLADWCAVDIVVPGGHERLATAHSDPSKLELAEELARYPPDPDAETGLPAVLRSGQPERFNDIPDELLVQAAHDEEHVELIRSIGLRAAVVVPMIAGDEVLGAMTFVSAESGRTFDDDDFVFLQDLGRRAAIAVQNGLRYAEQVRVAQTLQRSLLPEKLPTVPGWEASASYEPGDERSEVGGDFYDVVATDAGHFVFLGDVTGKGVEAAALTALVRHSAQMAARFTARPATLLGIVNDVVRDQVRLSPVSLVVALVQAEPDRARVTIASAGHPLPLLRRDGAEPEEVGSHDVLLGVVEQQEFSEQTVEVEIGDALLFYTDGVIDAPGDNERFGEERLRAAVASAPAEPSALLHTIESALRRFVTEGGVDDRAMIALRYTGNPARALGRGWVTPVAAPR